LWYYSKMEQKLPRAGWVLIGIAAVCLIFLLARCALPSVG